MNGDTSGHSTDVQTEPGVVSTERGQVILDGPDGVAVTMTPEAAAETGRRLVAGAERVMAER
ncbi:MAG: hypothetical protein PGN08_09735 [Sphingomonas taxi]